MTQQTQALLEVALALPEAERALLAERLLESLPEEGDELSEEELVAELDRRRAEIVEGKTKPIPWSDIRLGE
jgi:putative addiction module component (TIGR02574 family)